MALAVGFPAIPRRADKVLKAITDELMAKAKSLNQDATIRSVTVVVKLRNGSDEPRAVLMTVETERTIE